MSNSLVRIIDYALLPAAVMLLGKLVGIYFVTTFFNIPVGFQQYAQALFGMQPVVDAVDLQTVSSYSDIFMFAFVAIGFAIVMFASVYLHETHIDVKTINVLAKYNLLFLIKSSFDLYHSGFVWFVFTWVANLVILINVLAGATYMYVLVIAAAFSLGLSLMLFKDLFSELELTRKKLLSGK